MPHNSWTLLGSRQIADYRVVRFREDREMIRSGELCHAQAMAAFALMEACSRGAP